MNVVSFQSGCRSKYPGALRVMVGNTISGGSTSTSSTGGRLLRHRRHRLRDLRACKLGVRAPTLQPAWRPQLRIVCLHEAPLLLAMRMSTSVSSHELHMSCPRFHNEPTHALFDPPPFSPLLYDASRVSKSTAS
jgi:hypothetical protein